MKRLFFLAIVISFPCFAAELSVGQPFDPGFEIGAGEQFVPDESSIWELVPSIEGELMVRSFVPGEVEISGSISSANESERRVSSTHTIESVLRDGDLEPSSLADPVMRSPSPAGWIIAGSALVVALLLWMPLLVRRATGSDAGSVRLSPREAYLAAIEQAARSSTPLAEIADATRLFLVRTDTTLARDRTTAELLPRLSSSRFPESPVRRILEMGDLEKFSPWGAGTPIDEVVEAARVIAQVSSPAEESR